MKTHLALLSLLIPGLGQMVGGRRTRGLLILGLVLSMAGVIWWAATPPVGFSETSIPFKGDPTFWWWLIAPALIWLWNVWDAAEAAVPAPGWIPTLVATVMFVAIGWQATQVDVQAMTQNAGRAYDIVLRPMMRPDFMQPSVSVTEGWVTLYVPCPPAGQTVEPVRGLGENTVTITEAETVRTVTLALDSTCANVGDTLTVTGSGFRPNAETALVWQSPIGDFFPLRLPDTNTSLTVTTDAAGNITTSFVVPNAVPLGTDTTLPQDQRLYLRQSRPLSGAELALNSEFFNQLLQNGQSFIRNLFNLVGRPFGYELSVNGGYVLDGVVQSIALAIMATTFGALLALPLSFLAARNLMGGNPITLVIYVVIRTLLNILRSIESLIFAIVFVVFVGFGPFAGMLAVTLHTIAALAKLYSEVIEGIDFGPIEAMQAVGANWFQIVRYGVVPQIIPPFTAFTIYRWEINVRASTVIGLVGGGGIGFFLIQWINLGDYRAVGATFIAILVVVMTMDFLSARIRAKLI